MIISQLLITLVLSHNIHPQRSTAVTEWHHQAHNDHVPLLRLEPHDPHPDDGTQGATNMELYAKESTEYDGVLQDEVVYYLKLDAKKGVVLPVGSTGATGRNIDWTFQMWLKLEIGALERAERMYLFSIQDGMSCFFTKTRMFMCDSNFAFKRIQVDTNEIEQGKWIYLTVSGTATGQAYVQFSTHKEQLVFKLVDAFFFRQSRSSKWRACLGECNDNGLGFIGGIREFSFQHKFTRPQSARVNQNSLLSFTPELKAYFRFSGEKGRFERNQITNKPWIFPKRNYRAKDYIGTDLIPNDICPPTWHSNEFIVFNKDQTVQPFDLSDNLPQNDFRYTLSITFYADGIQCFASDIVEARKNCHLFLVNELVMLYFYEENLARLHFYAHNDNEFQSSGFFVPLNQWLTIQITISQSEGYRIVLIDSETSVLTTIRKDLPFRSQMPERTVYLFKNFNGYIDQVKFCRSIYKIPIDPISMLDCPLNIRFKRGGFKTIKKRLKNFGSDPVKIYLKQRPKTHSVLYEMSAVSKLNEHHQFVLKTAPKKKSFDGIACKDGHMTFKLDHSRSQLSFKTVRLRKRALTVEFWFKLNTDRNYNSYSHIFSLHDGKETYMEIFIAKNKLVCALFSKLKKKKRPYIAFTNFTKENADAFGWWHISCSLRARSALKGVLFNQKIEESRKKDVKNYRKYIPKKRFQGFFGKPKASAYSAVNGVRLKEFRLWTRYRSNADTGNTRYQQLDPTAKSNKYLVHYLRLASGSKKIQNFARFNTAQTYKKDTIDAKIFEMYSFVEDYALRESQIFERALNRMVTVEEKVYHVVCPLHTYFTNNRCYRNPVNKIVVSVFPEWRSHERLLYWKFQLLNSSLINQKIMQTLKQHWSSPQNPVLQHAFDTNKDKEYSRAVNQEYLRNEGLYTINVKLEDYPRNFVFGHQLQFVPLLCQWFTVDEIEKSAEQRLASTVFQGETDFKFNLTLTQHPDINCGDVPFYDQFMSIDFDFVIEDTVYYLKELPKMIWAFNKNAIGTSIWVTMPAVEQYKLPLEQDVGVLMTLRWTSSRFQEVIQEQEQKKNEKEKLTFQHALQTIRMVEAPPEPIEIYHEEEKKHQEIKIIPQEFHHNIKLQNHEKPEPQKVEPISQENLQQQVIDKIMKASRTFTQTQEKVEEELDEQGKAMLEKYQEQRVEEMNEVMHESQEDVIMLGKFGGGVESDVSENDVTEDDNFEAEEVQREEIPEDGFADYDDELSFVEEPEEVEKELKPSLEVSPAATIQGRGTITLDASKTTVTNMAPIEYQANVRFLWTCPPQLQTVCPKGLRNPTVQIPWQVNLKYDKPYEISLIIMWRRTSDRKIIRRRARRKIVWQKPENNIDQEIESESDSEQSFETKQAAFPDKLTLVYSPWPILVTAKQPVKFGFASKLTDVLSIDWKVSPNLRDPTLMKLTFDDQYMEIDSSAFAENTNYTVTATVEMQNSDENSTDQIKQASVSFMTKAPPMGGLCSVTPQRARIGQELAIECASWFSRNLPVVYNVYSTSDAIGVTKLERENTDKALGIDEEFKFNMRNANPVQVEVTDESGEHQIFLLFVGHDRTTETNLPKEEVLSEHQKVRIMFDKSDEDNNNIIDLTEFATFLVLSMQQSGTSTDLIRRVQQDHVIQDAFKWTDANQNGELSWSEVWYHISTAADARNQTVDLMRGAFPDQFKLNQRFGLGGETKLLSKVEFLAGDPTNYNLSARLEALSRALTAPPNTAVLLVRELLDVHPSLLSAGLLRAAMRVLERAGWATTLHQTYIEALEVLLKFDPAWTKKQVARQMDRMCAWWGELPFEYDGRGEIGVAIARVSGDRAWRLEALDASYVVKRGEVRGEKCAQFSSIKGSPDDYSRGRATFTLFDIDLNHTVKSTTPLAISFAISPTTYTSNQTICSGACATTVRPESFAITCECAMAVASVTLVTDRSRVEGPPLSAFETIKQLESIQTPDHEVVLCLAALLITTTTCMVYLYTVEQQAEVKLPRSPLLELVASDLNEPLSSVTARQTDLLSYCGVWRQSLLLAQLQAGHPLFAPFCRSRVRVERFALYVVQVYGVGVVGCEGLVVLAVLMMPWLSDPLICAINTKSKTHKLLLILAVQTIGLTTCLLRRSTTMADLKIYATAFLLATFVMNPAWVALNSKWCQLAGARQVCSDYAAVRKAEEQIQKQQDAPLECEKPVEILKTIDGTLVELNSVRELVSCPDFSPRLEATPKPQYQTLRPKGLDQPLESLKDRPTQQKYKQKALTASKAHQKE